MRSLLEVTLPPEEAAALRSSLTMLAMVRPESIGAAIDKINQTTSVMPMIDPSAWLDGNKRRNAETWVRILRKAAELRDVLPEDEVSA